MASTSYYGPSHVCRQSVQKRFSFLFSFLVQNIIFGWVNGKVLTLVDRRLTLALTLLISPMKSFVQAQLRTRV